MAQKKTIKQVAAALLAGAVVVTGTFVMQFEPAPAQAQNRTTVQSAHNNHQALRYLTTALPDGETVTADLLQDAADTCSASRRAVEAAEIRHYASGTPTIASIKALIATEVLDCAALDTLRTAVDQAKAAREGAKKAYDCTSTLRDCDGGSP